MTSYFPARGRHTHYGKACHAPPPFFLSNILIQFHQNIAKAKNTTLEPNSPECNEDVTKYACIWLLESKKCNQMILAQMNEEYVNYVPILDCAAPCQQQKNEMT